MRGLLPQLVVTQIGSRAISQLRKVVAVAVAEYSISLIENRPSDAHYLGWTSFAGGPGSHHQATCDAVTSLHITKEL